MDNKANSAAPQTNAAPIQAEIVQNIPVKQPDTPDGITTPVQVPAQPQAEPEKPAAKAQPAPAKPKPPKPAGNIPHMAIFMAIVVSAVLIAAAYYAFHPQ